MYCTVDSYSNIIFLFFMIFFYLGLFILDFSILTLKKLSISKFIYFNLK